MAAVASAARPPAGTRSPPGSRRWRSCGVLRGLGYESVQGHLTGAPAALIDLRDLISRRRVVLPPSCADPARPEAVGSRQP